MPDNYAATSNGNLRSSFDTLNAFFPKFALHKSNELLNNHIYTLSELTPYSNNPDFYIVEPLDAFWGVRYPIVYAQGYGNAAVVRTTGTPIITPPPPPPPPPPPTTTSAIWGTFSASQPNSSYFYSNSIVPNFVVREYDGV